ncbi:YdcF family protein [Pseudoflavonifractor sp.]|jgi:vancomycin permeability regulator SanA|uniref:YdcF family protein n=1 Tax=Pseudoflavonifractor sp. TaxID=1980281 RepID=UPI003D8E369B
MKSENEYRIYGGKNLHPLLRVVMGLVGVGLICFAILATIVCIGKRTQIQGTPKVMIILGCKVEESGPSELLRDRLDTALDYLNGLDSPIPVIVSGGQGKDEPVSEASAMADYLIKAGYDKAYIYLEDNSHNTAENLGYSAALLESLSLDPAEDGVLIVSNGFHLTRARMLAERFGYEDVSTLAAPTSHLPSRISMFFREPLALVKSFLFDREMPRTETPTAEVSQMIYGG